MSTALSGATGASTEAAIPGRLRKRRRGAGFGLLLIAPAFSLMVLLVLLPAARSLLHTVLPTPGSGFSVSTYQAFFSDPRSVENLIFTLEVTVTTLVLLLIIGLILALYLTFSKSRLGSAIQVIALFPLFVPGIIVSFALIRFLGPTGVVPLVLGNLGIQGYQTPYLHPSGAVIGMVWENLPLTVMLLTAGLAQIPRPALEAARDVGAGAFHLMVSIILPQLIRPIVVVTCLNFLGVFGSFTVPYILGPAAPQMMSIFMQRTFSELHLDAVAETQAAITFLVCLLVGAIYTVSIARQSGQRVGPRQ